MPRFSAEITVFFEAENRETVGYNAEYWADYLERIVPNIIMAERTGFIGSEELDESLTD